MKKEDKKVPDAPKRLWVCPYHYLRLGGLIYANGHSYANYWEGHEYPKNFPQLETHDEEYISLSQTWHEAKEVPEDLHTYIICVSKNFTHPIVIDLEHSCIHTFYDAHNISDKMKWNGIIRKDFRFAYWAYVKDLVPTIEEGGTR